MELVPEAGLVQLEELRVEWEEQRVEPEPGVQLVELEPEEQPGEPVEQLVESEPEEQRVEPEPEE